jgi:hypothetical protein
MVLAILLAFPVGKDNAAILWIAILVSSFTALVLAVRSRSKQQ